MVFLKANKTNDKGLECYVLSLLITSNTLFVCLRELEDKLRQTQRFNTTNKSASAEKSTSINMLHLE